MSREIKFRTWDKDHSNMLPVTTIQRIAEWGGILNDLIFMQYTGLKDKNGTEIYEGDILASTPNTYYEPREIVWFEHEARFGIRADEDEDHTMLNAYYAKTEYEVIGNIYENPELLK